MIPNKITQQEKEIGIFTLKENCGVRPSESVVIITDQVKKDREAQLFFQAACAITEKVTLKVIPDLTENAQEPPADIASAMSSANIVLLITSFSLTHTHATHQARQHGARVISMPDITVDTILRTLGFDYQEMAEHTKQIADIVTKGSKAYLTSDNGTEMTFDIEGRSAAADTGFFIHPGDSGNLPAGEAYIAPNEGKSDGILVFDGAFAHIQLDQPITVIVKHGNAVDIRGGEGARILRHKIANVGEKGYNIAELGIGTNKHAKLHTILLEEEKVYQTVHVALGNNAFFGGTVDVPFHSDGVILKPTLYIDNLPILHNGHFTKI